MNNENMKVSELVETNEWKTFSKKLELYGSIIFIAGFVLFLFKENKSRIVLTAGLASMAITYFFIGFNILKTNSNLLSLLFYKIHGWSMSIGYLTVMFGYTKWPFPVIEGFYISGLGILISLLIGVKTINNGLEIKNKGLYFTRLIITAGFLIYSFLYLNLF